MQGRHLWPPVFVTRFPSGASRWRHCRWDGGHPSFTDDGLPAVMKEQEPNNAKFDLAGPHPAQGVHRFAHSAMATVFEIHCIHPDAKYAGQAAQAAFDLVDRLELELSRFIENSDISRINSLEAGESTRVSPRTLECLAIARRMYLETEGAFDISIGTGFDSLEIDPQDMTVRASMSGVQFDLGGIGKGYAVDRVAELLEDWDVTRTLLHGGFSSVLALEPPPDRDGWLLTLSRPGPGRKETLAQIHASRRAFSASGLRKGNHIIDPRDRQSVRDRIAAWVSLPRGFAQPSELSRIADECSAGDSSAAVAEAFSTAFMVLSTREIAAYCEKWEGLEAWLIDETQENEPDASSFLHFPER